MKLKAKTSSSPYFALDIGDRYIGTAFSEAGILVSTGEMIDRQGKSDDQIFKQMSKIIRSKEIRTLVVGLPVNVDGSENNRCTKIRDITDRFKNYLKSTSYKLQATSYFPEDFTSIDAHLLPKPKLNQKTKTSSHSQAARIILERFLESRS